MAPLIVTMIRHGESKDNLTALWAGHRDAPLSNHGFNQATRLGQHFADTPITAIYTSDLKRAQTTARALLTHNKSNPTPPFTISPLLREQFFGEAEGSSWDAGTYSSTHLPWEDHRSFRLAPHAESLNEVGARADQVFKWFVLPHLKQAAAQNEDEAGIHMVLVAHGIWLSEMMFSFKRHMDPNVRFHKTGGYQNTAWARVQLELVRPDEPIETLEHETTAPAVPSAAVDEQKPTTPTRTSAETPANIPMPDKIKSLLPTLPNVPERDPTLPPPTVEGEKVPRIRVKVLAINQSQHLQGLVRTKGGVGSAGYDEKQRGLAEFFGGGGGTPSPANSPKK